MRNITLDLLKILLSIFVMLLHLKFLASFNMDLSYLLVNGIFRIAVPTFLIINGYYLYKTINSNEYFKNQKKLVVLYITWMCVYSYFWIPNNSGIDILLNILFGYHLLWYIPGLILASLVLRQCRNLRPEKLLLASLSLYLIGLVIQYIVNKGYANTIITNEQIKITLYRNFLFDCFPFLCFGFLLNKLNITETFSKFSKKTVYATLAISICLLLSESIINKAIFGINKPIDLFIFSIPTSTILFLIAKSGTLTGNSKNLSDFATAIFFAHVFCIKATNKIFDIIGINNKTVLFITIIVFTLSLSYFLTLFKKVYKRPLFL